MIQATSKAIDGRKILSDLVHYRTYANTLPNGRKESRDETISRVEGMHKTKFPWYEAEISEAFGPVYAGSVVPSMRTMQFGGMPVFRSNARAYNCAYAALTGWQDFADLFWLLMNGTGTGYSVQQRHISRLPYIRETPGASFVIPDSKEGWADSIRMLLENPAMEFVYDLIRPKGAPLSTGGTASGPESLQVTHEKIRALLKKAIGRKLTDIECHDVMCMMADVVVVGGVRRAALICLFDADSEPMLTSKHGDWYEAHPYRERANNSAVLHREDPQFEEKLRLILQMCFDSNAGEPGVILTNDFDMGFNPCAEIALRDKQMCNLTEINAAACEDAADFLEAAWSAAAIGTLQATYTDFSYLQPQWKKNCDEEALIGVSITGQAQAWGLLTMPGLLEEGAATVLRSNREWAERLGINPTARATTTKPSGSTSAWWGTTSGIHAAHSPYYLRRMRVDRKDAFGKHLIETYGEHPAGSGEFVETDAMNPENIVVTVPVNMTGAIMRADESAVALMERAKFIRQHWIEPGHVSGANTHNVSLTVNYRKEEEVEVVEWMVENAAYWTAISLLPHHGGIYQQMPFEEISEFEFHSFARKVPANVDFSQIDFSGTVDERLGELACVGGASCEIR